MQATPNESDQVIEFVIRKVDGRGDLRVEHRQGRLDGSEPLREILFETSSHGIKVSG